MYSAANFRSITKVNLDTGLIRYPVGAIVEGVVLARQKNRMRVAAAGFPDTIELRRSGNQWYTADREQVEFDFLMSTTHQ